MSEMYKLLFTVQMILRLDSQSWILRLVQAELGISHSFSIEQERVAIPVSYQSGI